MKTYKVEVDDNGSKEWRLNGQLHREDGPAVEFANGSKYWYLNDRYHREDGPAVERANGSKYWYLNGKCHRDDGPAVEYASGINRWWLNGVELSETEWRKRVQKVKAPCVGKVVEVDGVKYELVEA